MNRGSPSPKTLFAVWAALLLLLALTWGVARLNLGIWNPVAAVTIAVAKMLLVVLIFMHVLYGVRLIWVFAAAGFFWLCIMISLTLGDYLTRGAF
ncbi:MAG TPA: cytochrome C oxidase subunit IV family protein [Verrucomicrobiae bacterium]|nr:cytochrome C oxidase subunit IV family protein [Verrucomicrobiae bacterium]